MERSSSATAGESDAGSLPVPGVRLGTAAAGIRHPDRDDLVIVELNEGATCAAQFTRNQFCAAPVVVAREHLAKARPRYLLINSGNANAGTGESGLAAARETCRRLAGLGGCEADRILPFSTGVIGEPLPLERILAALPAAMSGLNDDGWQAAARAIMTTDTVPKLGSRRFRHQGRQVTVTGMAKGAGMIRPDMATMLAYLATDLAVEQSLLQRCLAQAVGPSFNSITVDGDTSTNDACVLIASGVSQIAPVTDPESQIYRQLCEAVGELCMDLARAIIKDAEGATKLVEVLVEGAASRSEASEVAYTIAHSPLVKTALSASDPNWGRILAAVGRADVPRLAIEAVELWLDDVCIVRGGGRAEGYTEQAGQAVMAADEFTIRVKLGRGGCSQRILTCDLSQDYVRINADYRT